jgi:GTP-binding protein Era
MLDRVSSHPRLILAVNKVDRIADKRPLLPHIENLSGKASFQHIIPLSAKTGDNVGQLEQEVIALLPHSPPYYPDDQITDRSERFIAAEIVREELMKLLKDELPYLVTVEIESYADKNDRVHIGALIWVEQERHKAMVIGKDGDMLKCVGTRARKSLEQLMGTRVFLELWVKVQQDWTDDERTLNRLGYN